MDAAGQMIQGRSTQNFLSTGRNFHRRARRQEIQEATELDSLITAVREDCSSDVVRQYVPAESMEEQWDVPGLEKALAQDWQVEVDLVEWLKTHDHATDAEVLERAAARGADRSARAERDDRHAIGPGVRDPGDQVGHGRARGGHAEPGRHEAARLRRR